MLPWSLVQTSFNLQNSRFLLLKLAFYRPTRHVTHSIKGVASLYVKKLSDAIRDGDPVRSVIRGTAVNGLVCFFHLGLDVPSIDQYVWFAYKFRFSEMDGHLASSSLALRARRQ